MPTHSATAVLWAAMTGTGSACRTTSDIVVSMLGHAFSIGGVYSADADAQCYRSSLGSHDRHRRICSPCSSFNIKDRNICELPYTRPVSAALVAALYPDDNHALLPCH